MFNFKKFLLILILSPAVIWSLIHPMTIVREWMKFPSYFKNNIHSIISSDKVALVDEARWNAFGPQKEETVSTLYYNKATVLIDDFFSLLTSLSPRIYFQSGDGSSLSPPRVEPVAIPLFVFWVMGTIYLVKNKKFKLIIFAFLFAVFAYIFGQRNLAYLFPILIIYIIISSIGIETIKSAKLKNIVYLIIPLYELFLLSRVFLLK